MAPTPDPQALADQARDLYIRHIDAGMEHAAAVAVDATKALLTQAAAKEVVDRRLDTASRMVKAVRQWRSLVVRDLRNAKDSGASTLYGRALDPQAGRPGRGLSLVDDAAMELEVIATRMTQSMLDRSNAEFNYLRTRMCSLLGVSDLAERDMLRPHVLARMVLEDWREAELPFEGWMDIQYPMQDEFTQLANEAYYETNRWLRDQGVLPDIDPRHRIRRSTGGVNVSSQVDRMPPPSADPRGLSVMEQLRSLIGGFPALQGFAAQPPGPAAAQGFLSSALQGLPQAPAQGMWSSGGTPTAPVAASLSPAVARATEAAVQGYLTRLRSLGDDEETPPQVPEIIEQLDAERREIKQVASSREERSTIEVVALMFQNILSEDRLPPGLRVWFARLQVPVMRVAMTEPEFFADPDHPARRLIDRLGESVLGLGATGVTAGDAVQAEIRRIVQVIEAYPETGSRVFRTVLEEFESFLQGQLSDKSEANRRGVTLAQQIEQRETLVVRFTIELRKMLDEVPVAEGIRQFLFDVWADVMATAAVADGVASERAMAAKRVAADLIWSAAAKVSREERAEVLKKLPTLQRALREGMVTAGVHADRQDELLKGVNEALAAGFTAKAAVIPSDKLRELTEQFEALSDLLPDADGVEFDEATVREITALSGSDLQVVASGGDEPDAESLSRARTLAMGGWFELQGPDGPRTAQLVWRGMGGQLYLFLTPEGAPSLYQFRRLAAHLKAGLVTAHEQETVTARASRKVLDILLAEPQRLEV